MFDRIAAPPADPVFEAMARYSADRRPERTDLGIGVFHDEHGASPLLAAVGEAEEQLARASRSKAYLPLAGDPHFLEAFGSLILGDDKSRAAVIQSTGGTGAVRLAFELVKLANPAARVHLGVSSWPNHAGIAHAVGLELRTHQYLDRHASGADFEGAWAGARSCAPGDIFILHGPGHNPTGLDLARAERNEILGILAERGAVPIIDVAYWGLCEGLEADLGNLRHDVSLIGNVLVAVSCSKAFGLYRERAGALFALTQPRSARPAVQAGLERISRVLFSTAPAHGAAVIARILGEPTLKLSGRTNCRGCASASPLFATSCMTSPAKLRSSPILRKGADCSLCCQSCPETSPVSHRTMPFICRPPAGSTTPSRPAIPSASRSRFRNSLTPGRESRGRQRA